MANQSSLQDPNQVATFMGASGTAGTAETRRGIIDDNGNLHTTSAGGTTNISGTIPVNLISGTLNSGTIDLLKAGTITALPNIPGGTINAATAVITSGTISNNMISGTLNVGTATIVGGTIQNINAGTINELSNLVKGTVTRVEGGTISTNMLSGTLNLGTVNMASGTLNLGTVNLSSGTLNLGTVNMTSGTFNVGTVVSNGGTIGEITNIVGGTITRLAQGSINVTAGTINTGTVTITSGSIAVTAGTETISAGSINVIAGTVNAGTINTGTINLGTVVGQGGTAASLSGNPFRIAGRGGTTVPGTVADGQLIDIYFDNNGRLAIFDGGKAFGTVSEVSNIAKGTITSLQGGTVSTNMLSGTLNVGTTTITSGSIVVTVGTITAGTISNIAGGTIQTNILTGTVTNVGTVVGMGTVTNVGQLYNAGTVQTILSGTITNSGTTTGVGVVTSVTNLASGTLAQLTNGTVATNMLPLGGVILSGTVGVGTTATAMPASALTSRKSMFFYNVGTATIYYGGSGVGTLTGVPVGTLDESRSLDIGTTIVYGICTTAGGTAITFEVS